MYSLDRGPRESTDTYYITDLLFKTKCQCQTCTVTTAKVLRVHSPNVITSEPTQITAIWTPYPAKMEMRCIDVSLVSIMDFVDIRLPSSISLRLPTMKEITMDSNLMREIRKECLLQHLDIDCNTTQFTWRGTTYYKTEIHISDFNVTAAEVCLYSLQPGNWSGEAILIECIE